MSEKPPVGIRQESLDPSQLNERAIAMRDGLVGLSRSLPKDSQDRKDLEMEIAQIDQEIEKEGDNNPRVLAWAIKQYQDLEREFGSKIEPSPQQQAVVDDDPAHRVEIIHSALGMEDKKELDGQRDALYGSAQRKGYTEIPADLGARIGEAYGKALMDGPEHFEENLEALKAVKEEIDQLPDQRPIPTPDTSDDPPEKKPRSPAQLASDVYLSRKNNIKNDATVEGRGIEKLLEYIIAFTKETDQELSHLPPDNPVVQQLIQERAKLLEGWDESQLTTDQGNALRSELDDFKQHVKDAVNEELERLTTPDTEPATPAQSAVPATSLDTPQGDASGDDIESPFPYEILNQEDKQIVATPPVPPSAPTTPAAAPTPSPATPTPPTTPATPEKTKEDIEGEITKLQEDLGPVSMELYAARANAEQKAIKNRSWVKRTLAKGGFGGAVDPNEFDQSSKDEIKAAEEKYTTLASQLEQKLDERTAVRFRERVKGVDDEKISQHIARVKARKEAGSNWSNLTKARRQAKIDVHLSTTTSDETAAYKAGTDKNFIEDLKLAKTSGRFRGIYLKQAEVDRKMYVESLPPQERAKVMEYLDKARAWNKKYRHVRIIGTAAALTGAAVMTGGVAATMTPIAMLFGGKIARAYGGIGVGLAAAGATHRVIGHIGKNKIEKNENEQTKSAIETLREKQETDEVKKQEAAQKIIDEKARAEKRLNVKQKVGAATVGVVAGAGFAYGAGAAGLGRAPQQMSSPRALGAENIPESKASPAPVVPNDHQTPEVQAALAHDPPGRQMSSPRAVGAEVIHETVPAKPTTLHIEGNYKHGQSITRVIDNELKKQYTDLSDTQRARVAYRLALGHGHDEGFHAQRGNINLVHEGDHYKVELDKSQIQAEIDRVKGSHYVERAPIDEGDRSSVRHGTGGKPHEWVKSRGSESGGHSIDASRTALEKQFGLYNNTRFWNLIQGENVMHLKEITDSTDPTALEQFARAKGVSVDDVRDMVNRIDALSRSGKTPIGPLDTPGSLLERAAQVRAGHFVDTKPKTIQWLSEEKPATQAPASAPTPAPASTEIPTETVPQAGEQPTSQTAPSANPLPSPAEMPRHPAHG
jgi:hypothetical protein